MRSTYHNRACARSEAPPRRTLTPSFVPLEGAVMGLVGGRDFLDGGMGEAGLGKSEVKVDGFEKFFRVYEDTPLTKN